MPATSWAAGSAGVLPTDYQYTWAQENYSKRRRALDSWSFVLTLRARLWLLDQVWRQGQAGVRPGAAPMWCA